MTSTRLLPHSSECRSCSSHREVFFFLFASHGSWNLLRSENGPQPLQLTGQLHKWMVWVRSVCSTVAVLPTCPHSPRQSLTLNPQDKIFCCLKPEFKFLLSAWRTDVEHAASGLEKIQIQLSGASLTLCPACFLEMEVPGHAKKGALAKLKIVVPENNHCWFLPSFVLTKEVVGLPSSWSAHCFYGEIHEEI